MNDESTAAAARAQSILLQLLLFCVPSKRSPVTRFFKTKWLPKLQTARTFPKLEIRQSRATYHVIAENDYFMAQIAVVIDNVFPVGQVFSKMYEKQGENHRSRLGPSARRFNTFRASFRVKVDNILV